ncbi:MAG: ATP phosphoribosyltransferase regulatory subunit, partial [Oscillospiraceae bacterium]|nr:ATP phosphoribosyltransferase regulatory subunit [Oscillospiraceae bacterium]
DQLDSVCITFDKLDKIGVEGIQTELTEKGFPAEAVANLVNMINDGLSLENATGDEKVISDLKYVIDTCNRLANGRFKAVYDPSLVRGMGYYTGMVFEIGCSEFSGSIAGGGRYDDMVGKFLGEKIPAVGFSIGFERIFGILAERGFQIPTAKKRLALLYGIEDDITAVIAKADELRAEGYEVNMLTRAKKMGKQIASLTEWGYGYLLVFGREEVEALEG